MTLRFLALITREMEVPFLRWGIQGKRSLVEIVAE